MSIMLIIYLVTIKVKSHPNHYLVQNTVRINNLLIPLIDNIFVIILITGVGGCLFVFGSPVMKCG